MQVFFVLAEILIGDYNGLAFAVVGYDYVVALFYDCRNFGIIVSQIPNSFNVS